jgi:ElaB/YqjD/DUF883 family membrane-anchored ribosome-binding protein
MSELADRTVARLNDFKPANLRERLSNVVELFAEQLTGAARGTGQYVRANPWQTVGAVALMAMAAGMLVGRATRRVRASGRGA